MYMIQCKDMQGKPLGYLPGEFETVHEAIESILRREPTITLARAAVLYRITKVAQTAA